MATSFASLSYVIAAVCANEVPAMMERLYILGLAMITLYWIAFVPPGKSYQIGIRLTHVNGDFDAISMTERSQVFILCGKVCRVSLLLTAFNLFAIFVCII